MNFYSKVCNVISNVSPIPQYLKLKNLNLRRSITKCRISAHNYACLTSKYKLPRDREFDEKCLICNVKETEEHVLLHCVKYTNLRQELFIKVDNEFQNFSIKPDVEKIKIIKEVFHGDYRLNEELGYFLMITQKN